MADTCRGPSCRRPAVAHRLCASHYRQEQRGVPLRPLRGPRGQLGAEPLVRLTLRVEATIRDAAQADPDGARAALGSWSAQPPPGRARCPIPSGSISTSAAHSLEEQAREYGWPVGSMVCEAVELWAKRRHR